MVGAGAVVVVVVVVVVAGVVGATVAVVVVVVVTGAGWVRVPVTVRAGLEVVVAVVGAGVAPADAVPEPPVGATASERVGTPADAVREAPGARLAPGDPDADRVGRLPPEPAPEHPASARPASATPIAVSAVGRGARTPREPVRRMVLPPAGSWHCRANTLRTRGSGPSAARTPRR